MANRKISDLAALTAPATGDLLPIVDISEAAAADKNKKITFGELLSSAPAGSAAAPSFSFDADPNTGLFNPAADTLAFAEGGTEAMRIDSSGRLLVGTSTANTSGAKLQTSDGLTFPATAVASADPNTLDDYEEGTWTPTVIGTGTAGTGTYSIQAGNYTKIGRQVYVNALLGWSAHTGTGGLTIAGLPFAIGGGSSTRYYFEVVAENLTYIAGRKLFGLDATSTTFSILEATAAAGFNSVAIDTSVNYMVISGTYQVG